MTAPALRWVTVRPPHDVEAAWATMKALGVLFCSPQGVTRYWVDPETSELVKDVGDVTVGARTGRINVWPHVDGDERDLAWLMGMAELAFTTRPTKATGYQLRRRQGRSWWHTGVVVPARRGWAADQRVLSVIAALPSGVEQYLDGDLVHERITDDA